MELARGAQYRHAPRAGRMVPADRHGPRRAGHNARRRAAAAAGRDSVAGQGARQAILRAAKSALNVGGRLAGCLHAPAGRVEARPLGAAPAPGPATSAAPGAATTVTGVVFNASTWALLSRPKSCIQIGAAPYGAMRCGCSSSTFSPIGSLNQVRQALRMSMPLTRRTSSASERSKSIIPSCELVSTTALISCVRASRMSVLTALLLMRSS